MNKCKYIEPIHPKVKFGVELKEIYPPWYLHPALKNLIYLAEINIRNRNSARFDVEQLLGKGHHGEGSVKQRLELKERLVTGKNILDVNVAPGIPIWLIRHFLGLLPTPIFPPKYNGHYWYNFSVRWYEQFIESIKKRSAPVELKDAVAFELSHLPGRNLTFLFELFELIRFLSMKSMSDDVIDKHAALLLVRYFTPSLINRPYRPGILTKDDKKYFAFILFTVHFWPELKIKIHDILMSSMNKNPDKFYYYPEIYDSKYSDNNDYLKDIGTQTKADFDYGLFLSIKSSSEDSEDNNCNNKSKNKYLQNNLEELLSINTDNTQTQSQNELKSATFIQEQNNVVSSTPKSPKTKQSSLLENINQKNIDEYYETITKNNCTFLQEQNNVVSSTPKSPKTKQSSLLENISQKNIDEYYETITKNNCKFLQNTSTQTDTNESIAPEIVCPHFGVKINSRVKKKIIKKPQSRDIVILEIPYNKRKNQPKINIITCKKYNHKTLKIGTPKKSKIVTDTDENDKTIELKPKCSSVTYGWNIDSTLKNGEYIYDSYVGNCYEESPLKAKQLFSSPYYDVKLNNTPQLTPSVDLYKRITKYGWTYNRTSVAKRTEPYKLLYESDDRSLKSMNESMKSTKSQKSLNSETPLTENVKKKKCYSDFVKTFFKKITPGKQETNKCSSCTDLNCSIKYEKIAKSANSL